MARRPIIVTASEMEAITDRIADIRKAALRDRIDAGSINPKVVEYNTDVDVKTTFAVLKELGIVTVTADKPDTGE